MSALVAAGRLFTKKEETMSMMWLSELNDGDRECFKFMCKLWREREGRVWVSQVELHKQLVELVCPDEGWDESDDDWIDDCLDAFAISGPKRRVWEEVFCQGWSLRLPQDYECYRYPAERVGQKGYVRLRDLTVPEFKTWVRGLKRKGKSIRRQADRLKKAFIKKYGR
jgi:hypothetical protein